MTDPQAALQNAVTPELCWHCMPLHCPPVFTCWNPTMPIMSLSCRCRMLKPIWLIFLFRQALKGFGNKKGWWCQAADVLVGLSSHKIWELNHPVRANETDFLPQCYISIYYGRILCPLWQKANQRLLCKQYTAVFCALNQIWSIDSKNILQDLAGKNDQENVSHESILLCVWPNTAHRELQSFTLGQWFLWIILLFSFCLCTSINSETSFTCIVVIYSNFRHFLIR